MNVESPRSLPSNVFVGGGDDMHDLDPRLRGGDNYHLVCHSREQWRMDAPFTELRMQSGNPGFTWHLRAAGIQ